MNSIKLEDINSDEFVHSRIYEFIYEPLHKIFKINFGFAVLKKGGTLVDCTITITDWWNVVASFSRDGEELSVNIMPDFIIKNHIDSAIYKCCSDKDTVVLKGHSRDCLFSLEFTKPKVSVTGQYEPD